MPRNKKVYRKKAGIRRVAKRKFPRPLFPLADHTVCKHRYVVADQLDPAAATSDYITIKLNSMYDPTTNASDHQPSYHDEMMALYHNYVVLGARVRVAAFASTYVANTFLSIRKDWDTGNFADMRTEMEQQRGGTRFVPMKHDSTLTRLSYNWSAKKEYRGNPLTLEDYFCNNGEDCATPLYAQISIGSPDQTANQTACNITVIIDYIVHWFRPREVAQS